MDSDQISGTPVTHLEEAPSRSLTLALEQVKAKGLKPRLRIAIALWNGAQYVAWKRQSWMVDVDGEQSAREVKEALELFFDSMAQVGAVATGKKLVR